MRAIQIRQSLSIFHRINRIHHNSKIGYSIPPAMEEYILPKYFHTYTEVICKYEKNAQCFDDMIVPDLEKQKEVLRSFEWFKNTYPMDDSPSLQYGIMNLIVHEKSEALDAIKDLLNTDLMALQLIRQILQSNIE